MQYENIIIESSCIPVKIVKKASNLNGSFQSLPVHVPVGAPWDGGCKADVGEEDGVVFDAVQGIVHLTQRQPVQLELQLHLTEATQSLH